MKGLIGSRILIQPELAESTTDTGLELDAEMLPPPPSARIVQIGEEVLRNQASDDCLVKIEVGDRVLFQKDRAWFVMHGDVQMAIIPREHLHAVL